MLKPDIVGLFYCINNYICYNANDLRKTFPKNALQSECVFFIYQKKSPSKALIIHSSQRWYQLQALVKEVKLAFKAGYFCCQLQSVGERELMEQYKLNASVFGHRYACMSQLLLVVSHICHNRRNSYKGIFKPLLRTLEKALNEYDGRLEDFEWL